MERKYLTTSEAVSLVKKARGEVSNSYTLGRALWNNLDSKVQTYDIFERTSYNNMYYSLDDEVALKYFYDNYVKEEV